MVIPSSTPSPTRNRKSTTPSAPLQARLSTSTCSAIPAHSTPYLQVLDSQRFIIADNDDIPGAESKNARIENLLIEEDGVYIIVASRYGEVAGDSAGSFVLSIDESTNSGLGNSTLAPFPMQMNQVVEGEISASNYERYYTFNARKDDLITIKMDRNRQGRLDSYLILANAGLISLIEDDDSGQGKTRASKAIVSQPTVSTTSLPPALKAKLAHLSVDSASN